MTESVVIILEDADDLVESFGKLTHENPLIAKAIAGTLTKKDMDNLEYTELLRLAKLKKN